MVVFGPAVPALLVLAPLVSYMQWAALRWQKLLCSNSFGELVASNILTQQPNQGFKFMAETALWLVGSFLMWDMEFDWRLCLACLCAYPVAVFLWLVLLPAFMRKFCMDYDERAIARNRTTEEIIVFRKPINKCSYDVVQFRES